MKIDTLRKYFCRYSKDSNKKTHLFVMSGAYPHEYLVAGIAFNPRESEDAFFVDMDPCISYSFESDFILRSDRVFTGLKLIDGSKFTRKIETHIRHAKGASKIYSKGRLERYFQEALELVRV